MKPSLPKTGHNGNSTLLSRLSQRDRKVLLPILHGITHHQVARYSPMLADKLSTTTERGIQHVAVEIAEGDPPVARTNERRVAPRPTHLTPLLSPTHDSRRPYGGSFINSENMWVPGGSGVVFRASHRDLGDQLAIKLFYPLAPAYAHFHGLFDRGFRALSRLKHPNIVLAKDFGRADLQGLPVSYLVMDYITGQSLDRWSRSLGSKPDALALRIRVTQQLAAAMLAAHETIYVDELGFEIHGVLHGDLKPSNILIGSSGIPIILDFLLVDVQRLLESSCHSTLDTASSGTTHKGVWHSWVYGPGAS